jgi:hypothetical protein
MSVVNLPSFSVGGSSTVNTDVDTRGWRKVGVYVRLAGTVTPGDLTIAVRAYDAVGSLLEVAYPADTTTASAAGASDVFSYQRLSLYGVNKIQVRVVNANIGAKTATITLSVEPYNAG